MLTCVALRLQAMESDAAASGILDVRLATHGTQLLLSATH